MTQENKRSELLLPAGSLSRLKTAILYGADAVYAGTPDLSLRTKANFTLEELVEGVQFAHSKGKKIYLTLNLYTHNKDVEKLNEYLDTVEKVSPDGLIIADPGVFQLVKERFPSLPCHISTQANVCSWLTVDFWKKMGAELCVLAREVNFKELSEIREKCPDIKLEAFVHGAMCMTYSGRCLLSNFMAERGANQGNCAHSCRWRYKVKAKLKDGSEKEFEISEDNKELFDFFLEEEFREDQMFEIIEDDRGSYILNSKDMCLMPRIDDYLRIGVDSLKIEGRNKTEYYVAIAARAYRQAIDDWYKDPENWSYDKYLKELLTLQNRGYTLGFHEGRLTNLSHNYDHTKTVGEWKYAGLVREWQGDDLILEIKNYVTEGDVLEFLIPNSLEVIRLKMYEFIDAKNGKVKPKYSAGYTGAAIRIPASLFNNENVEELKEKIVPFTVARRFEGQAPHHQEMYEHNIEGLSKELGKKVETHEKTHSAEKCCGKGCNGCAVFWNSPEYAEKREELRKKKIGEMLKK
jgi:putative protease